MRTIGYILLFFSSLFLICTIGLVAFLYSIIKMFYKRKFKSGWNKFGVLFFVLSVSLDQFGNVLAGDLFNDILIKENGHKFGNEDYTVSHVLGVNKSKGTLTKLGSFLDRFLHLLDPFHVEKSIEK